jgi:hypothetical protein
VTTLYLIEDRASVAQQVGEDFRDGSGLDDVTQMPACARPVTSW